MYTSLFITFYRNCPSAIYLNVTLSLSLAVCFVLILPEPFVQVSHDPAVADFGQQSVSAGLCSASVLCLHSRTYYLKRLLNNKLFLQLIFRNFCFVLKLDLKIWVKIWKCQIRLPTYKQPKTDLLFFLITESCCNSSTLTIQKQVRRQCFGHRLKHSYSEWFWIFCKPLSEVSQTRTVYC